MVAALSNLFITSIMPVLQVLLLTVTGAILAFDRVDILGENARKPLNNVLFYVFMPALVGSNLAKYVTYKNLVTLWFMPVNVLITFVIGSALGWLVNKITRAPYHLQGLVLGCCATGNLGNLSFILIPAVCVGKGSPFGDVNICHGHAMAYATLSMAFGNIFMWSYVYNLMRRYSPNFDAQSCNSPPDGSQRLAIEVKGIRQRFKMYWKKLNLGKLFAPTTIAAVVGLAIGVCPPFRKGFIGGSAPLRVVEDSAYMLGQAAIPSLTINMGANLLKGLKGSRELLPIICGIIGVRFIVLPFIGVGIIKFAVHFGLVWSDPLFKFALLLQFAMPPAVNIGTMMQMFGAGESECSVIMLFAYALASVSLTAWSTFYMWLVG